MTETDLDEVDGDANTDAEVAKSLFAQELGVTAIESLVETVGNRAFLKFIVGRDAPLYDRALRLASKQLPPSNVFKGHLGLSIRKADRFPESLEARALSSILTRSTRAVAEGAMHSRAVPFVPFQNGEDQKVTQPATHLIVGRRGVGKSTLIIRAMELLSRTKNTSVVQDMQSYSELTEGELRSRVLGDLANAVAKKTRELGLRSPAVLAICDKLGALADRLISRSIGAETAMPFMKKLFAEHAEGTGGALFVFLDDFHLVKSDEQPSLLQCIHGCLKGANGWLKVAGLRSLLNAYDPKTGKGLQVPGDAQLVSLDLTLVDPETAEAHLRVILEKFLQSVGVDVIGRAIAEAAFRRLVWANAGVPRDFLQMFGRSLEHAQRSRHKTVLLTDTNLSIGEFGQQKMDELERDARNEQDGVRRVLGYIEKYCLDEKRVNAFLIRSERSVERTAVLALSDLRIVHLIHPTITPHKAGERYEAYLVDYSLFTGFRRRPYVREMLPADKRQFKAAELRTIPTLPKDFFAALEPGVHRSA